MRQSYQDSRTWIPINRPLVDTMFLDGNLGHVQGGSHTRHVGLGCKGGHMVALGDQSCTQLLETVFFNASFVGQQNLQGDSSALDVHEHQ